MLIIKYSFVDENGDVNFVIRQCDEVIERVTPNGKLVEMINWPTQSAAGNSCPTSRVVGLDKEKEDEPRCIYVENMHGRTVHVFRITPKLAYDPLHIKPAYDHQIIH